MNFVYDWVWTYRKSIWWRIYSWFEILNKEKNLGRRRFWREGKCNKEKIRFCELISNLLSKKQWQRERKDAKEREGGGGQIKEESKIMEGGTNYGRKKKMRNKRGKRRWKRTGRKRGDFC